MNKILYAMVLSLFLAVFSFNSNIASADEAAATEPQEVAAAETPEQQPGGGILGEEDASQSLQNAIDNLKTAISDFESTQQAQGENEHLRAAVDNAKTALDSAEKSMEHARVFQGTEQEGGMMPAPAQEQQQ